MKGGDHVTLYSDGNCYGLMIRFIFSAGAIFRNRVRLAFEDIGEVSRLMARLAATLC